MEAQLNGITLTFKGTLDEHSSPEFLHKTVKDAMDLVRGARVRLDFSQVRRANSCGILTWFKLLEQLKPRVTYINVPVWLVEQFNFSDALRGDALVESFQAPFYCPDKDAHAVITLTVGREVPLLADYSDFTLTVPGEGGAVFEPDFEPEEYFQFLAAHHDKFKAIGNG